MSAAAQPVTAEQAMALPMSGTWETSAPPTCGARGRKGAPCGLVAGWGTDHAGFGRCKLHGGNTPNHRTHHLRLVEAMVPDALAQLQRQLTAGLLATSDIPEQVRFRAVQEVLDRVLGPARTGDVSVTVSVSVEERQAELLERAKAIRAGVVLDAGVGAE